MLRIAALQIRTSGDRAATLVRAAGLIASAAERGAEVVCLPEAFTGLYGVDHFAHNAEEFKENASGTALMAEASKGACVLCCVSLAPRCDTRRRARSRSRPHLIPPHRRASRGSARHICLRRCN